MIITRNLKNPRSLIEVSEMQEDTSKKHEMLFKKKIANIFLIFDFCFNKLKFTKVTLLFMLNYSY